MSKVTETTYSCNGCGASIVVQAGEIKWDSPVAEWFTLACHLARNKNNNTDWSDKDITLDLCKPCAEDFKKKYIDS